MASPAVCFDRHGAISQRGSPPMPTLDFKGKQFVYAHHLTVPFRSLEVNAAKSCVAKGHKPSLDDNLIIHGDNLHARSTFASCRMRCTACWGTDR